MLGWEKIQVPKLYYTDLTAGYEDCLRRGFEYTGITIRSGENVFVKPNLTYPTYQPGVMTSPKLIEALVVYLKNFTDKISLCEADSGGYNPFRMDEVFERTGLTELSRRYGVRLINFSNVEAMDIPVKNGSSTFPAPFPKVVKEECERFITVPVFKVHLNTRISVALKNQWALIPIPAKRLDLHPSFSQVIYAVNKNLPNPMAIVDGTFGLTRTGPLRGDAVALNSMVVSDNLFYTDLFATQFMGVSRKAVHHIDYALRQEGIDDLSALETNMNLGTLPLFRSRLEREWTDYPGLLCFKSKTLAYVGYKSPLAKSLHWLLYKFRTPFY